MTNNQLINHPKHYNIPGKKECIVQMRETYGDYITAIFCLTNAYKYFYRAGEKEGNSKDQDIAKAVWYVNYVMNELQDDWRDIKFQQLYTDMKTMCNRLTMYNSFNV